MMCVSVRVQPVSPGPILIGEQLPPKYMIGGIAFGASDCRSQVRADVLDETGEDCANETVTVNTTARAELQAAGIDMAFHDLLLASGLNLETLQVKLPHFLNHEATDHSTRILFDGVTVFRFFRWLRIGTCTWRQSWRRLAF